MSFGLSYLPVFVWVSANPAETEPTPETYLVGGTAGDTNAPLDFQKVMIVSFAFLADGNILAARGRNFDAGIDLEQGYTGFSKSGANYSFYNGEWYSQDKNNPGAGGGPVQDRQVTGFQRLNLGDAERATTLGNGPHCGTTNLVDEEGGNRARACLGTPGTIYWKRHERTP